MALLVAIPLLLATAAYFRVIRGDFVFDDVRVIQRNAALAEPGAVVRGFPAALLKGGRPTTEFTFALNRSLGGLSPAGFHATNLLLHLVVVLLVFLFTRAVLR